MISIIIPTLNRAKQLSVTLNSLLNQTSLADTEIIVINNGSTDETNKVLLEYSHKINSLKYECNTAPGLLTGRHRGIEISTGEILCFLDDDVELNPGYVEQLKNIFNQNRDIHFATGPNLPIYEIEPPAWLPNFWETVNEGKYCYWLSLLDFGKQECFVNPNYVWGLNFCCRKNTLISLGGFHPDSMPKDLQKYQGDGESGLTIKAFENGHQAYYTPKLLLYHHIPASRLTIDYFKQRAFFQGVCNSFTLLRKYGGLIPKNKKNFKDQLRPFYRSIRNVLKIGKPITDLERIISILKKQQNDGFEFHQSKFKTDDMVKSWVLKENYWNYNLPS